MAQRILIVDANEAFATMLHQGLEEIKGTHVKTVFSGHDALRAVSAAHYDLIIVDLGLPDVEGTSLVRTLRQENPHLRIMIIPLGREEVPPELADLDLQGVLSKPFFLPELPDRIREALSRPLRAAPPADETPSPAAPPVESTALSMPQDTPAQAVRELSRLAQEVGADAVLLTDGGQLIAHAGRLRQEEVAALAAVVSDSWSTAARVAKILDKEQLRFEQSIEGGEYLLYSLALAEQVLLSLVIASKVPLGMIRHRAKETAEAVRRLMGL